MNGTIVATCRKPHSAGTFKQRFEIYHAPIFKGAILPIGRVVDIEYLFPTSEDNKMNIFDYDYMLVRIKRPVYTSKRVYAIDDVVYIATFVDTSALFDEWFPNGFPAQKT